MAGAAAGLSRRHHAEGVGMAPQNSAGRWDVRVMIFGDMEGVSCIEVWEQVNGGAPLYEEGRVLFTEEMNAAVRGAKRAGATDKDKEQ